MAASTGKKKSSNAQSSRSTARTWKRNKGEDLLLPSDNIAYVKRPGPAVFLTQGLLPDSLTPIVEKAIKSGKGMKPEETDALAQDPKAVVEMLDAMDRILVAVVIEPKVTYHRRPLLGEDGQPLQTVDGKDDMEDIPDDERDEEALYSDEVDLNDKMFIFNFAVGGTRDLERFREEFGAGLGDLPAGEE